MRAIRQRREQYLTFAQSRAHFRRHENDKPQTVQIFVGKSRFLRIRSVRQFKRPRQSYSGDAPDLILYYDGVDSNSRLQRICNNA